MTDEQLKILREYQDRKYEITLKYQQKMNEVKDDIQKLSELMKEMNEEIGPEPDFIRDEKEKESQDDAQAIKEAISRLPVEKQEEIARWERRKAEITEAYKNEINSTTDVMKKMEIFNKMGQEIGPAPDYYMNILMENSPQGRQMKERQKLMDELKQKNNEQSSWECPSCGNKNSGKFCTSCGTPRP